MNTFFLLTIGYWLFGIGIIIGFILPREPRTKKKDIHDTTQTIKEIPLNLTAILEKRIKELDAMPI